MSEPGIERRRFLGALAATTAAATSAISGCQTAQGAPPPVATPEPAQPAPPDAWARVKDQFELSREWLHFAGFLLASHPKPVREAIERHRRGLDENPALYLESRFLDNSSTLQPAAAYLGVEPNEIALTDSTTMGLATLYGGLPLGAGDEVLTTTHDHYSTHESLRFACERASATLKRVPLYERSSKATLTSMVQAIERAITPKTRLVAITWVHSSTGVKTPVKAIAEVVARQNQKRAPERRVFLAVDGVHGIGIENVTMADLGCDFFVAGTHKWLFGPRGTGLIWGKAADWALLRPSIPHFGQAGYEAWMRGTAPPATTADMMTPGGFHSFEHRWALGAAFDFHLTLGKAEVQGRIHELNRQCKEGLAGMKHVTLHTPLAPELSSGIITFEVAGMKPDDVVKRLHEKRVVASTTPYAPSYARLAPGLLNSPEEVASVLALLRTFT
jgi:selenocysteine lyase/cysteine desulfurase